MPYFKAQLLRLIFANGLFLSAFALSEKDILEHIFANYSKAVRPRRNASLTVEVALDLEVRGIHDLLERENTLIIDGYINAEWRDDYLIWNTSFPHLCYGRLVVPPGSTWLPDISSVNAPNGLYSLMMQPGFGILLASNGTVNYSPGGQIVAKCDIDVTYFPFDRQVCHIKFESWNYQLQEQVFAMKENAVVRVETSWTENRQWQLESNFTKIKVINYGDFGDFTHITFVLVLRRKALFYYVNIIVPSIVISFVETATFALPIAEVLKVHISFTCLLAYSVFQGMVMADLPRSGDAVPLLSLYIDLQMAYIGFIALMGEAAVFLAIRKAKQRQSLPPKILFAVAKFVGRIVCVECCRSIKKLRKSKNDSGISTETNPEIVTISVISEVIDPKIPKALDDADNFSYHQKTVDDSSAESIRNQWMFVAEVVEQVIMVLYCLAITITPIAMFSILPSSSAIA